VRSKTMERGAKAVSLGLVLFSCGSLVYGVWRLAEPVELWALYWLVSGGLALAAASDREQSFASR
jgi:hypothetical protein